MYTQSLARTRRSPWNNSVKRNLDPRRKRLKCTDDILELRRPPVLPHVARAPARLDLRVLDLAVDLLRLDEDLHEDVAGLIHRRRHGRELPGVVEHVPEAPPRDGRRDLCRI